MDGRERIGAVIFDIKLLLSPAVGGSLPVSLKFYAQIGARNTHTTRST